MSTLAPQTVVPLYAGFWRRAAAAFVDGLVLFVPNVVVGLLLPREWLALVIQVGIGVVYYAFLHSSESGATLGKKAFGIKVVGLDGERISLARGVGRYFATWVSGIIIGIGFLMAAFTKRKQALHD